MNQIKQIGRYLIREEIGSGGMATVYRAYDPKRKIDVALKVLHANFVDNKDILQRFIQEARAAASLQHPNIIPVHDFGSDGRNYYITIDYIPSGTLETLLKERPVLSPPEAVSLLSTIASALHQAHQIRLIHRDIKPANILIDPYGNPILTDFGIARVHGNNLTKTGSILGTPNYMSPEQAKGEVATQASDIYALGVVLFQAVTGKLPFNAQHERGVMYQHVHELPQPPRSIKAAIPPRLEVVILTALEKKPQNRFSSAKQMAQAMQASLIENRVVRKKPAKPIATSQDAQAEPARRGLVLFIVILLFVLGMGGIYFYGSWSSNHNGAANGVNGAVAQQPQPTTEPTLTQQPTHTTLPGEPTSTPRPTFTPPPELPSECRNLAIFKRFGAGMWGLQIRMAPFGLTRKVAKRLLGFRFPVVEIKIIQTQSLIQLRNDAYG